MKVVFFWLTMGAYHRARMRAISNLPNVKLKIIELTHKDDHFWEQPSSNNLDVETLCSDFLTDDLVASYTTKILDAIESFSPDIIINGAGYSHPRFQLQFLRRFRHTRKIVWSESTALDNPQRWYKKWLKSWIVKRYDGGLVAGNFHLQYLRELGLPSSKIFRVGNVVDNQFFSCKYNKKGVLFVGRLLKIKNIAFLLDAYSEAVKSGITRNLTIVGDGPERKMLEKLVQTLSFQDRVTFLGNLQPEKVKCLYCDHDIFVLPSFSEPWGLVLNEAMAAGLAVIATDKCGAVNDLVVQDKTGYVVSPIEKKQLTDALIELDQNNILRKRLSEEGKKHVQEFSPNKYAERCMVAFETLLQS